MSFLLKNLLSVAAAVGLLASINMTAQAQVLMNAEVNDGSFELSWGVDLGGTDQEINNSEVLASSNNGTRTSGIWSYDVTDLAGTALPRSAGSLGFVEFGDGLGPASATNQLFSDGTGNPEEGRGVSAFSDPADRIVTFSTSDLALPGNLAVGNVLDWSFDLNGIEATSLGSVDFGADFGNGFVPFIEDATTNDGDAAAMQEFSGTYTVTSADLVNGTWSTIFTITNMGTGNGVDGRLFLDNISVAGPNAEIGPGDVNGDGNVDAVDYGLIRDNFRGVGQGDIGGVNGNPDGVVDFYDFIEWRENAPASVVAAVTSGVAVPEPASCLLALLGLALFGAQRRRN